ncbi:hypothetical protein EVA_19754 [gut metagenome]|uniref:Uncharacterized protein n=1 Tax=gut metagenome TaxID=749906 RepID=J9FXS0_9ZZZZ
MTPKPCITCQNVFASCITLPASLSNHFFSRSSKHSAVSAPDA